MSVLERFRRSPASDPFANRTDAQLADDIARMEADIRKAAASASKYSRQRALDGILRRRDGARKAVDRMLAATLRPLGSDDGEDLLLLQPSLPIYWLLATDDAFVEHWMRLVRDDTTVEWSDQAGPAAEQRRAELHARIAERRDELARRAASQAERERRMAALPPARDLGNSCGQCRRREWTPRQDGRWVCGWCLEHPPTVKAQPVG